MNIGDRMLLIHIDYVTGQAGAYTRRRRIWPYVSAIAGCAALIIGSGL